MWGPLHSVWSRLDNSEIPVWKKGNELFEAFIEQVDSQKFLFSIDIPDSGHELYQQVMEAAVIEAAFHEGNRIILEFLTIGAEMLGNFKLMQNRPSGEVRFRQVIAQGSDLFGLDEEGVLWKLGDIFDKEKQPGAKKPAWIKQSMERFG